MGSICQRVGVLKQGEENKKLKNKQQRNPQVDKTESG